MQKLKKKYINNLLNYQPFLKNNYLKKNIKNTLFESNVLFQNKDLNFNVIEINNNNNISLPISSNLKTIYTIKTEYENQLLFNYNLNFNIISNFNKILLTHYIKKNKLIKGRIIGGNNEKIFVYVLGLIFSMEPKKLNILCNSKKKTFNFNKLKKKGYYSFVKLIKAKQIIKCYKLRYLNFNIDLINNSNFNKKLILSRISYIERLIQNKELKLNNIMFKKKKRILSRKLHVQKINHKKD